MVGAEAGIDGKHVLKAAQEGGGEGEEDKGDGDFRDDERGAQPGVAGGSGAERTPSLRLVMRLVRRAAKAGARLQRAPVTRARRGQRG